MKKIYKKSIKIVNTLNVPSCVECFIIKVKGAEFGEEWDLSTHYESLYPGHSVSVMQYLNTKDTYEVGILIPDTEEGAN
jgi:hypothetical protein